MRGNLLKDKFPNIYKQIHPTLNPGIDFDKLTCSSAKQLWWRCDNPNVCDHHVWQSTVSSRTRGSKCRYCNPSNPLACICTSLSTLRPEIAKQIDYEHDQNKDFDPTKFTLGSGKYVYWKCTNPEINCDHHRWGARIADRTAGHGCPYCSHHKVCPCESFAALYPDLLKEFDYNKNQGVNPVELSCHSHKTVWWKCIKLSCGKEWETRIKDRIESKTGCPRCRQSHLEKICIYILKKHGINFKDQKTFDECKYINKLPFDFSLLDLNILAELDGEQHFTRPFGGDYEKLEKCKIRDKIKTNYTRANNIHFVRIS